MTDLRDAAARHRLDSLPGTPVPAPVPAPVLAPVLASVLAPAVAGLWAALVLLLVPAPAAAWDDVGHRVVAAIAWERMSPDAREAAVELLLAAPADSGLADLRPRRGSREERQREHFLAAATWPDRVKGTAYHHGGWHYVNHFWRDGRNGPEAVRDLRPAPQNAVERLSTWRRSLADTGEPAAQRALDLAWVLHVVGDLHQPLHVSSRVTDRPEERRGDRGGNSFDLHRDDRGRRWSLHGYWDTILKRGLPQRRGEGRSDYVQRLTVEVEWRGFEAAAGASREADFDAWVQEGLALAQQVVYRDLRRHREPSRRYLATAHGHACGRLYLAGVRLAALLEEVLVPGR